MTDDGGSTCVITGGASGIGLAVLERALADRQFGHCAVLDREEARFDELAGRFGERVTMVGCDVGDAGSVEAAFGAVDHRCPPITGLVNCAGITKFAPTVEQEPEAWDQVMAVNLTGTLNACVAAAKRMRSGRNGAIVNLASVSAFFGWPRRAAYSASKAGVLSLTRTLAVEWAADGIRVNAVVPGYIRTEMVDELITSGQIDYDTYAPLSAAGRFAAPDEVAAPILFLLSEQASFITAVSLPVDGGFSATKVP
jgi:NAD(P)-dependent dehydrogenase (short-subunit alcohol dehydrogenase family)